MIRVAVMGAAGRMGRRIMELGAEAGMAIVAAVDCAGTGPADRCVVVGGRELPVETKPAVAFDVMIDFSAPEGTMSALRACVEQRAALVSGTTGLTDAHHAELSAAAKSVPVLWASNFSPGIQALTRALTQLVRDLGDDYDIEVVESHHRRKVDAPSGTALSLVEALQRARAEHEQPPGEVVHGRLGAAGPRPAGQIGLHALRLGDEVGRHEVHFGGLGETLTIAHTAWSRDTFARGAILAVKWIAGKPPGRYSFTDACACGR